MAVFLEPGRWVGGVRIVRSLGGGGEGDAYLADTPEGRRVVLKQFRLDPGKEEDRVHIERIERHTVLVGQKHPNVAEVLGFFWEDATLYMVTEYCEGETLDKKLATRCRLSLEETDGVVHSLLAGLGWLHERGILHRDVKPENIVVQFGPKGVTAKLIDLGIALHMHRTRLTKLGAPCTLSYTSPESFLGPDAKLDGRADLYVVGIVLYECLTGHNPHRADSITALVRAMTNPERPSVARAVPGLPEGVDAFVQRLLALNPDDRYTDTTAALDAWQAAMMMPRDPRSTPMPAPAPIAVLTPGLRVDDGPLAGTVITVPPKGIALGRADINPDDERISRIHLSIRHRNGKLLLHDCGDKNGLQYKGKRLRTATVQSGDTVTVGHTRLRFTG